MHYQLGSYVKPCRQLAATLVQESTQLYILDSRQLVVGYILFKEIFHLWLIMRTGVGLIA